jgi:methionyl-tRNA formyltransferase
MRLVMMGTGTFAEPTFRSLLEGPHPVVGLATQPERATGQVRGSTRQTGSGMAAIGRQHGVPIIQPESINSPEGVALLKDLRPELLVVAAYGQILSNEVLSIPERGGINVHASLLPRYRGAAPVAWAVYHGESKTGVTIIRMSVRLDAGDILAQQSIDIGPDETAGELETRLARLGAQLALLVIDQIAAGTEHGVKQDASLVSKAPKLNKEHGQIDWTRPALSICDHVRAMQPWPTAYTYRHRQGQPPLRLIIKRAVLGPAMRPPDIEPGMALFPASNRLLVTAGDQAWVEILELQPAGKKTMTAGDFLRGHPSQPGDRFGPEIP